MTDWIEDYRSPTAGLPLVALLPKDGKYWWSGSEQVVGDLADVLGAAVGSVTANGLEVLAANASRPVASGALSAAMNATGGFTILMQIRGAPEFENIPGDHMLIQAVKTGYANEMNLALHGTQATVFDYNMSGIRANMATPLIGTLNKLCATVKTNGYALAVSGGAVGEEGNGVQDGWETIRIGWYDGDVSEAECYFEKIIVWATLPPSEVESFAAL